MASLLGPLSSLLSQTSIDDHEEVLKAANAALGKSAKDVDAQHVKVVALLKLDRFDEALRTLEHGGDALKQRARLEWAYALYKAGQPGKAAEIAGQVGGGQSDRGMRHVEAQASYRHEDFERAAALFAQLASADAHVPDEDMDLRINTGAVNAQMEWSGLGHLVKEKKPQREDLQAFETAYNAACGSIARDELGQAEVLLRRSRDLCDALEDLSEEDKHAELLPIIVQQIYVLVRQGRTEEAAQLASGIAVKDITESSTHHIADINITAASSELTNPYLTHRIIHKSPETITPDRPFAYQSAAMHRNNYALDLLSQKYSGIIFSTTSAVAKHPSPTLDANVNSLGALNAAAHARNQAGKDAIKAILPVLDKRPTDVGLVLVAVQLYVFAGNHGAAIVLLESLFSRLQQSTNPADLEVRYAPGLVGTMVSLYSARGQTSKSRAELAKAAKYWRQRSTSTTSSPIADRALAHLYKSAGAALLASHDSQDQQLASEIFSDLRAQDKDDRYTNAGLVAALAFAESSSITDEQLSSLTPVDRLTAGIDVSALEEAGVAKAPAPTPSATATKRAAPSAADVSKKPTKIRKTKMPKEFDPNKKMDLERWLPLKDRSYYRPKGGKKAKAKQAMLTQGGVVDDSRENSRPGTPGVVAGEVVKASGGGQQKNKKKKGKGGKW
ncbi:hypothetical protein AAFC00_003975 [Neodothiora populina]|uniref:Signal recognition particle subunit SRP72 n=1 Tax=Neodothiora populina TaxID=2781224 RepID=A0ABR3PIH0_9PEZI